MKKLTSTNYSAGAFNVAMLLMRIGFAGLMLPHGYDKLVKFATMKKDFIDFLGLGPTVSLAMLVFAEFFCSALLILGLFSRLACIPLIIAMAVALFKAHHGLIFSEGEHATLFLVAFSVILLLGPGKVSVDGMMGK
ncbi:MAG: DoxX family protein [Chitinophagaceae bacterium]